MLLGVFFSLVIYYLSHTVDSMVKMYLCDCILLFYCPFWKAAKPKSRTGTTTNIHWYFVQFMWFPFPFFRISSSTIGMVFNWKFLTFYAIYLFSSGSVLVVVVVVVVNSLTIWVRIFFPLFFLHLNALLEFHQNLCEPWWHLVLSVCDVFWPFFCYASTNLSLWKVPDLLRLCSNFPYNRNLNPMCVSNNLVKQISGCVSDL